jgi:hypothetical protein
MSNNNSVRQSVVHMFDEMDVRVEAADFLESAKSALEKSTANKASFESELNELKHKLEMLKQEVAKRKLSLLDYSCEEEEARSIVRACVDRPNSYWFDILNQWMQFREVRRGGDVLYIEPGFCTCCLKRSAYWQDYTNAWVIFLKTAQRLGIQRVVGVLSGGNLERIRAVRGESAMRFVMANCIDDLVNVMMFENADRIGKKTGIKKCSNFEGDWSVPAIMIPVIPGMLVWRDKKDLPLSDLRSSIKAFAHK